MRILLVETFFKGSHRKWSNELKIHIEAHASFKLDIFSIDSLSWKEAMSYEFKSDEIIFFNYDLVITSSMVNLSNFKSKFKIHAPHIIYFHENQLAYPWTQNDKNGKRPIYSEIQIESAKLADQLVFNSEFNMNSFGHFKNKSSVLPLGIDIDRIKKNKVSKDKKLTLLWNHRWEYDKNPKLFFETLRNLKKNVDFNLIVTGESPFHVENTHFQKAREEFKDNIIHFGYAVNLDEYYKLLWRSHLSIVTSQHDFFGLSVCESTICNVLNILPLRLAYPEHFIKHDNFYKNDEEIVELTNKFLDVGLQTEHRIESYDWNIVIESYIDLFEKFGSRPKT